MRLRPRCLPTSALLPLLLAHAPQASQAAAAAASEGSPTKGKAGYQFSTSQREGRGGGRGQGEDTGALGRCCWSVRVLVPTHVFPHSQAPSEVPTNGYTPCRPQTRQQQPGGGWGGVGWARREEAGRGFLPGAALCAPLSDAVAGCTCAPLSLSQIILLRQAYKMLAPFLVWAAIILLTYGGPPAWGCLGWMCRATCWTAAGLLLACSRSSPLHLLPRPSRPTPPQACPSPCCGRASSRWVG